MEHSVFNLLGASLIPELGSDIAAGPAGYEHLILIAVSAVRALPYEFSGLFLRNLDLSIITAAFAVITLRI